MKPSVLCTICARGGSKGVPGKNIKPLHGLPLIAHTVLQAKASGLCDRIVVSTDSPEIGEVAQRHGAEFFFLRPQELASDTAGKLPVIQHALTAAEAHWKTTYDFLIDLDPTSPLRLVTDIQDAFHQMTQNGHSNLFSAAESRKSPYFNMVERDPDGRVGLSKALQTPVVRRQDAPKVYEMNASIYIWKRDILLNNSTLFLPETGLYEMPAERSIDIDSPVDFKVVEVLMGERPTYEH